LSGKKFCNFRWCTEQAESDKLINVQSFGTMYNVEDKQYEGISTRLSELYLKEHDLIWDNSHFSYEKLPEIKYNSGSKNIKNSNVLTISTDLNLPKIFVQDGLYSLFRSIGNLMSSVTSCVIDLGVLGSLYCNVRSVYHVPSKMKKENIFNKRTTVKALLGKYNEEVNPNRDIEKLGRQKVGHISGISFNEENLNTKQNNLLHKMRMCMKPICEFEEKIVFEEELSPIKKGHKKIRYAEYDTQSQQTLVPLRESDWNMKDMLSTTFKRSDKSKKEKIPVLFNVFSNTKAAPFTSEKTQIPISHRIGSFYTQSIQNFIIDKTTKSIKRLYDEYFYKYKNVTFDEQPATEEEEYLATFMEHINIDKVKLRKEIYLRYLDYINSYIADDYISDIKEKWLKNIVVKCMRAYNINSQEIYADLLNDCVREIIEQYKYSMRKSIIDYMLKHPEQRQKLLIPITFRKIKEYGEEKINRPSDNNGEWKRKWMSSRLKIANSLMIMGDNVVKINKHYNKVLKSSSFFELPRNWNTVNITIFHDTQKAKIEQQSKVITEDWKKAIEKIIKECTITKDQLMIYFKSVGSVMSCQLRKIIMDSLSNYHTFISNFKKTDYYSSPQDIVSNQFKSSFGFERSFIEVEIRSCSIPGKAPFTFSDDLYLSIQEKLTSVVKDVLRKSKGIERIDHIFIKKLDRKYDLWEVSSDDKEVKALYDDIEEVINSNITMVERVVELYEPFNFVITERHELEKFKESRPSRQQIKTRITFYEQSLNHLYDNMPNILYMNMIMVNCKDINTWLRESLKGFILDLLKYVLITNINGRAKELNDFIANLSERTPKEIKDNAKELVDNENELETLKTETIVKLLSDYDDFIEWIFFYFDYDTYPIFPDNKVNDQSLENTIISAHNSIKSLEPLKDSFSNLLANKRRELENVFAKEKINILNSISELRKQIDESKANANNYANSPLEDLAGFLQLLKTHENRINEITNKLKELIANEEQLGIYPTDDERLEQCRSDLQPLIIYFTFLVDFKENKAVEFEEIRRTNFVPIVAFVEKSVEVFELWTNKVRTSI
jgi:hypothetical protein